jgi:nucleotide-binding universal stress UspA family protein
MLPSILSPLGSSWAPPSKTSMEELALFGQTTLTSLAKQYGFAQTEQVEGDPADVLVARAAAIGAEMIFLGSRGNTGLKRLVLGSVAEKVIRHSICSVLVAR